MAIHASSFSDETRIQPPHSSICWEWSIRPMIIWLRIIGVDLPGCSTSSVQRNRRWLILVYRVICFLFHIFCQIHILHFMYPMLLRALLNNQIDNLISSLDTSSTAIWNMIIDFANYSIHGIGIHLILLTVIRVQWIDTIKTFQRLNIIFADENWIRIRKISFVGVIYVILQVRIGRF